MRFLEELEEPVGPSATPTTEPKAVWEIVEEVTGRIPREMWAELPSDGSINLDHYLYGGRLNTPITVSVYDGALILLIFQANLNRPHVGAFLGDNGHHGFSIPTPISLKTETSHSVHLKFGTSGAELIKSPATLTCASRSSVEEPLAAVPQTKKRRVRPRAIRARKE